VLDLYAGTGALALEALSRGAERACCVERDRRRYPCLLDAAVAVGEQVLLVLDDGMASVVLRYTAQAGDADVVLAAELDLVAVLTNTAQMGVADFV
jgi:16S rRNA (guanine966-N2)-methyltransferase